MEHSLAYVGWCVVVLFVCSLIANPSLRHCSKGGFCEKTPLKRNGMRRASDASVVCRKCNDPMGRNAEHVREERRRNGTPKRPDFGIPKEYP